MKNRDTALPEGLEGENAAEFEAALQVFTRCRRHAVRHSVLGPEGTDTDYGERGYTADEFRRRITSLMSARPAAIRIEVLPYSNGRGGGKGYRLFHLKFPGGGLGGVDKYGLPRQPPPGGGNDLRLAEQEHRFSTLHAAQAHEFEKRDLNARIRELEKEIRERDGKIAALDRERERIEEEFRREISGAAHRAKVAAEGLGGMMTGVVSTFFPAFASTAKERIGGLVSGLTGIPDLDLLDEPGPEDDGEPDENEPEPPAYSFSFAAHQVLCQMGPQEFRQLETLIGEVARHPDPGTRLWLLSALCESAAGLVKPAPRNPETHYPPANHNDNAA